MRIYGVLFLGIALLLVSCIEPRQTSYWKEITLNDNNIYLAFRGTKSKEGFFARDFNIRDSLSSHIGFLLKEKNDWYVYHVLNFKDGASDLRRHEASLFFIPTGEKLNYAAVWTMTDVDSLEFRLLKKGIHNYLSKFIEFDRSFTLSDSTKLYCSEFIFKVLMESDIQLFNLKPRTIKLSGFYASYFRKDSLEYIPVDLFQTSKQFHKLKEWIFD